MSDPTFTDLGLQDRSRVLPRSGHNLIPFLEVDELVIGGIRLYASQGTRYANGRLTIQGRDDNSCEIEQKPGLALTAKGVVTQIIWYGKDMVDYFKRFAISIISDGTDPVDDQRVVVDSTRSSNVAAMPVYMPTMGAMSNPDGTDVPNSEKYSFSYFGNGTHEMHIKDDNIRVEIASFAEAFLANDRRLIKAREKQSDGSWKQIEFTEP